MPFESEPPPHPPSGPSLRGPRSSTLPLLGATTSGALSAVSTGSLPASVTQTIPLPRFRGRPVWPLLPLAPAVVFIVGVAVALAIGAVGVDRLSRSAEEAAGARALLLADVVGARLAVLSRAERGEAVEVAARRSGAEMLVATPDGDVLADASRGPLDHAALRRIVALGQGEAITRAGRTRFAVRALEPPPTQDYLVTFVATPTGAEGTRTLLSGLLALTALLVGVATAVAYAVARDANADIGFVTHRVRAMARVRTEPTGEPVPVRALDEVGELTSAFNDMVGRFSAAEKKYRDDLQNARGADKDRASFLAAVSHELRSPLNAVLGFADVLMTEVDGPLTPTAKEEVEQIRGSGAHLLELINDILEFSALESGQLRLSRGKVDLFLVANDVVREAAGVLAGRPVQLSVDGEPGVYAHADPRRVRQIVQNLVGNAIKFTKRGHVTVSVSGEGSRARLSVSDTGPGISPTERARIFEEYMQAGDERTMRRGTGLGLAITRRLVLMHAGMIQVESELGRGSRFDVTLPMWFDSPNARAEQRRGGAGSGDAAPRGGA